MQPNENLLRGAEDGVLLLILVVPAVLLVMLCALERYERLIDRPAKSSVDVPVDTSADISTELTPEFAPEAA